MARKGGDFQPGDRIILADGREGKVIGLHGGGRGRKVYWHDFAADPMGIPTRSAYVHNLRKLVRHVFDRTGRLISINLAPVEGQRS